MKALINKNTFEAGGAPLRKKVLIGRRALNRIITVMLSMHNGICESFTSARPDTSACTYTTSSGFLQGLQDKLYSKINASFLHSGAKWLGNLAKFFFVGNPF